MNNGAVQVRHLSRNRHGATSPPSSKPYASSGCPRASNEARSRVAQAGKGVLVPLKEPWLVEDVRIGKLGARTRYIR